MFKCPICGLLRPNKENRCDCGYLPEEGTHQQGTFQNQTSESKRTSLRVYIISIVAAIVLLMVFSLTFHYFGFRFSKESADNIRTGIQLTLYSDTDRIIVAEDQSLIEKIQNAVKTEDSYEIEKLKMSERIFEVKNNTNVLILDRKNSNIKIRILRGPHTGKTGWVPKEWIQ